MRYDFTNRRFAPCSVTHLDTAPVGQLSAADFVVLRDRSSRALHALLVYRLEDFMREGRAVPEPLVAAIAELSNAFELVAPFEFQGGG